MPYDSIQCKIHFSLIETFLFIKGTGDNTRI